MVPSPAARAFLAQRLTAHRRYWRSSAVGSVLEPVLFLAAMGLTLGTLVDRGPGVPGDVAYLDFLAPGLLVAAAMQTATAESDYPVFGAITWDRVYEAVLATPARAVDVLTGHLLYVAFRVTTSATAFLLVLLLFGAAGSPLVVLTVPVALLTGLAFAAPVTAVAARVQQDAAFAALRRFLVVPMFLFSGVFFPVDRLPAVLEVFAWATPLWHGVALARDLALGTVDGGPALLHVGYLALWTAAGTALAARGLQRRLVR